VLFYADLAGPYVPPDLQDRPVGGSETALMSVAGGLAAAGHRVVVVGHAGPRAGVYGGVEYVDVRSQHWRGLEVDVTVVFRQLPHAWRRLPGRVRLFWAHDHLGVYPELRPGLRRRLLELAWRHIGYRTFGRWLPGGVVAVSEWLATCLREFAGWPAEQVRVIPNGVHAELFGSPEAGPTQGGTTLGPPRIAYTSVPERGLELLIREVMPRVWARLPHVELHVFSYRPLAPYRRLLRGLGQGADRVHLREGLPKHRLAAALKECHVWAYPTDFPETSCIAAMEAQAAGLPVVSSRRYALRETVEDGRTGFLIPGEVGSTDYVRSFADACTRLLEDPALRAEMGRRAAARVLSRFTWDQVCRRWSELLTELAAGPGEGVTRRGAAGVPENRGSDLRGRVVGRHGAQTDLAGTP